MPAPELPSLRRACVVLLPKAPVLEWLSQLTKTEAGKGVGRAAYLKRLPAFLVPPYADKEGLAQVLELTWEEMFEAVLGAWSEDPKDWPSGRSLAMFEEWFDPVVQPEVLDLGAGAL